MRYSKLCWPLIVTLCSVAFAVGDQPAPEAMTWGSQLLGKSLSCVVRLPDIGGEKKPVVVYLKNLPTPRLGELSDEALIEGFLEQGLIVIEADYQGDSRAVAPELLPEIDRWYGYLFNTEQHPVDPDWIYIVPAGYAIDRKVRVCEFRGRPVEMDVIHPSGSTDRVPLMLQITSTKETAKWINQRAYYIYGLLTSGYAGAIMDWNGTGPGAAPGGDVFPEKRAARLLRARADDWNLSGRLGVTGHSKGSSRAGKAAFLNEDLGEADRGPHADQSDRFQAALLSAGQHAPEFLIEDGFHKPVREDPEQLRKTSTLTYVTPDDPPTFLSVGALDKPFRVAQMKRLADRCKSVGVTHRVVIQQGMGHMYNPRPEVIGPLYDFLDRHLKPPSRPESMVADQRFLDRLASQPPVDSSPTVEPVVAAAESGELEVDSDAIATLKRIGAAVEMEQNGADQIAVAVDLRRAKVTDAELKLLSSLAHLRELRFDGVALTDDGFEHLQGMTSLQRLDLPQTGIGDQGLRHLKGLTNLRMLSIKGNRITDAGIAHLQGLTQLELLSLGPNQISDRGLEFLQNLKNLTYLNLTSTQITDASLEYLKPLSKLRTLRMRGTQVTDEGVQKLQQTLPGCKVSR